VLLACRFRRKIQEAGDRLQAAADDHAEVDAARERRAAIGPQFSGEADAVVMTVYFAGTAEPVPGKALLNPLDHGVYASLALALHDRVKIARCFRPGPRDEVPSTLGISFVPHGDVTVNQVGEIAHLSPL
jgi:hypothetical protein